MGRANLSEKERRSDESRSLPRPMATTVGAAALPCAAATAAERSCTKAE